MNIIEAIKSGKRIRRSTWHVPSSYITPRPDHIPGYLRDDGGKHEFCVQEILADDWEVEEKKVEVTEDQLRSSFYSARSRASIADRDPIFEHMVKSLGLRD